MRLTEDQHRAKIIELLDRMSQTRMDMWIVSGIEAGVLDSEVIERVLAEEVGRRSHEVQAFWLGACNCCGQLN